jgi:cytochrome c oxidase subunit IV
MKKHDETSHAVDSPVTYGIIWLLLMALLVATFLVAEKVDMGWGNLLIAMLIAGAKAVLVVMFFMQVRHDPKITRLAASVGFLWLAIMLSLTIADYATRTHLPDALLPAAAAAR